MLETAKRMRRAAGLAVVVLLMLSVTACGGDSDDASNTTAAQTTYLSVVADTVQGPLNLTDEQKAVQSCVDAGHFPRNSQIVWRVRVVDPLTGQGMDDTLVSVQVKLGDGQVIDLKYGDHPKNTPTDSFWAGSFNIPADYPSGTLSYEVAATGTDGRTGVFKPFNVASSLLTITTDTLPTIEG
jgi:hypothetical protein